MRGSIWLGFFFVMSVMSVEFDFFFGCRRVCFGKEVFGVDGVLGDLRGVYELGG